MLRLFRLMLVLIAVHITLIGVAHLLTRNEHPAFLDLFTNPDGTLCERPCLFGIQPGETSMDEALVILQTHWLLTNVRIVSEPNNHKIPLVANANGKFAGKNFLVWLAASYEDNVPLITASVALRIIEPNQDISSNFSYPMTSTGTLLNLLGSPDLWDSSESQYFNSFTHDYYFTRQHIRAVFAPTGDPYRVANTPPYTIPPTPHDVVVSFEVYDSYFPHWLREFTWCGFTLRICEPAK